MSKLHDYLCNNKKEFIISKQIYRSGTSIGANLSESKYAISKRDFLNKVHIALKEANETLFWINLLKNSDHITQKQYESLKYDCEEIIKLLSATTKTTVKNLNSKL